ncbi:MAG: glycoside hydrolase family 19 protein [Pseudomonadota bacterium]
MKILTKQFAAIMPLGKPELWLPALTAAMKRFEIRTRARAAAFLAQIAHESGQCRFIEERLSYSAGALMRTWPKRFPTLEIALQYERNPEKLANFVYANRMGNGTPESRDGFRFRGRGLIQMTGRSNYTAVSDALKVDFASTPDLMLEPRHASMSAAWFWRTRGLNELADDRSDDDDSEDFRQITRVINGGLNGLAERLDFWAAARRAFGIS